MIRQLLAIVVLLGMVGCSGQGITVTRVETPASRACEAFSAFTHSVHEATVSHEHRDAPGTHHLSRMVAELPLRDDPALDRAMSKVRWLPGGREHNSSYYGKLIALHQVERLCSDRGYETPSVPSDVILEYYWCGKGGGMADKNDYSEFNPLLAGVVEGYDAC